MTVPISSRQPTVGGLTSLIGDLEGRVDRVQMGSGATVADPTDECTHDCTKSCVTCDTCISCDTCTCTCIVCGDPTTTGPTTTGPTTIGPTTTLGPFGNGGWG